MDIALILASAAFIVAAVALFLAFFCAIRLNRVEWELEKLNQEIMHGVSSFPVPSEVEDMPAFLKRQAD